MKKAKVYTQDEMEAAYGELYRSSKPRKLRASKVPENLHALLPYASFWGVADDRERERLIARAPKDVQKNLKQMVAQFGPALDEWLAGPAADEKPTPEYVAFGAMVMAADYI